MSDHPTTETTPHAGLIDWSQVSAVPHPAACYPTRDDALAIDWTRIKGEIVTAPSA